MEITTAGFTAKDLVSNRPNVDQELTKRTLERGETVQKRTESRTAKPVDKVEPEKQRRIDIYV